MASELQSAVELAPAVAATVGPDRWPSYEPARRRRAARSPMQRRPRDPAADATARFPDGTRPCSPSRRRRHKHSAYTLRVYTPFIVPIKTLLKLDMTQRDGRVTRAVRSAE